MVLLLLFWLIENLVFSFAGHGFKGHGLAGHGWEGVAGEGVFCLFLYVKPRIVGESVAFCFMLHFSHGSDSDFFCFVVTLIHGCNKLDLCLYINYVFLTL